MLKIIPNPETPRLRINHLLTSPGALMSNSYVLEPQSNFWSPSSNLLLCQSMPSQEMHVHVNAWKPFQLLGPNIWKQPGFSLSHLSQPANKSCWLCLQNVSRIWPVFTSKFPPSPHWPVMKASACCPCFHLVCLQILPQQLSGLPNVSSCHSPSITSDVFLWHAELKLGACHGLEGLHDLTLQFPCLQLPPLSPPSLHSSHNGLTRHTQGFVTCFALCLEYSFPKINIYTCMYSIYIYMGIIYVFIFIDM